VTIDYVDNESRLWSLDGRELATFEGEFRDFTPDDQGLVTVLNGNSRLWSLDGREIAPFEGEFRGFMPSGQGLYTDSDYGITTLWNFSGQRLAQFPGQLTTSSGRNFDRVSEDGQYLITSLDNTTHRIWRLDNSLDDLLARGCQLLTNYFNTNPEAREEFGICLDQPF
jgi:WD40 repeat protein